MKPVKAALVLSLTFFILGCQPPASTDHVAKGRVVKLGKQHLILEDAGHVMFLAVDDVTKRSLVGLKRGDAVTLLGKMEVVEVSPGHKRQSSEVYAIEKEDGTRIALR